MFIFRQREGEKQGARGLRTTVSERERSTGSIDGCTAERTIGRSQRTIAQLHVYGLCSAFADISEIGSVRGWERETVRPPGRMWSSSEFGALCTHAGERAEGRALVEGERPDIPSIECIERFIVVSPHRFTAGTFTARFVHRVFLLTAAVVMYIRLPNKYILNIQRSLKLQSGNTHEQTG